MFVVLLRFSSSLPTKCLSLNYKPYMVRPNLIDVNPFELKFYPFMVSIDKCSGSFNVFSSKICVQKKKNKNKNKRHKCYSISYDNNISTNEAKAMEKHISCDCKCKFNCTTCNLNPKWNNQTCKCECKNYRKCKKIIVGILAHVLSRVVSN